MVLGGPQVLPGGCLVVMGHKMKVLESLVKGVFGPLVIRGGGGLGAPSYIIERNQILNGARQARKMLWDNGAAPFISGNHSHDRAPRRG